MVAGPTGSGKTELVKRLIKKAADIGSPPPVEIIYCYDIWQNSFNSIRGHVRFHEGMIDVRRDITNDGRNRWLVIDDLMHEIAGKDDTNSLFTKFSHHMNISVFFIVQNLFKKENRTVSLNSHYFFLFKNPRDGTSVSILARQAFPGRVKFVEEAYEDATKSPHSFLMVDLRQDTSEKARLIGNFASDSSPMVVYIPRRL